MASNVSELLDLPVLRAAYSDRTAWLMARCSQLAYVEFESGQEPQLRGALQELGLGYLHGFSRDATCAYLARNDRFAVLAFRGTTKDYRNILTDIKIRFYRDKSGARTATGFSEAYKLVQQEIADAISALDPSLPLYITGQHTHSSFRPHRCLLHLRLSPRRRRGIRWPALEGSCISPGALHAHRASLPPSLRLPSGWRPSLYPEERGHD